MPTRACYEREREFIAVSAVVINEKEEQNTIHVRGNIAVFAFGLSV